MSAGIEEIDAPPIDPFKISDVNIDNRFGGVTLKLSMSNVRVVGASKTKILEVRSNIPVRFS